MAFIDEAKIKIASGKGGDGLASFRREKFVNKGGPFGGDGGKGGDVIIEGSGNLSTLMDFKYPKKFKAKDGENGGTKGMTGAGADPLIIKVPLGTVVLDEDKNILVDITEENQQFLLLKGGRGGRGNIHFASPRNPAPEMSEKGELGKQINIELQLKVLADVGLIGLPSSGKSTFLSVISSANPKIGAYPFTTLSPNLGVVRLKNDKEFTVADMPGLIKGASEGQGLGLKFLKHISRTNVLLHFIDASQDIDDVLESLEIINSEIEKYDKTILDKGKIIVLSKTDLVTSDTVDKIIDRIPRDSYDDIFAVSSVTHQGIAQLLDQTANLVTKQKKINSEIKIEEEEKVFELPKEDKDLIEIYFDDDSNSWVIINKEIEEKFSRLNVDQTESILSFSRMLQKKGIDELLEKSGAKIGDNVRINNSNYIFEYEN